MASQRILKSKISWGGMPPNSPRGERALLVPSPSPVTLHYSPATTFLNENPASVLVVLKMRWLFKGSIY